MAVANPVSLSVPNFIKQHIQNWKFGEDLPEQVRNIIFSKDVLKLLHVKSEILETLAEVDIDVEIADISPEFLNRLNEAVGTALTVDESDPRMKVSLKEFQEINYESPRVPTGRICLRDDYLFTWYLKPRIQGHGKRKFFSMLHIFLGSLMTIFINIWKGKIFSVKMLCSLVLSVFQRKLKLGQRQKIPALQVSSFFPKFNY